ncbi:MAG TPA: chromosome segregation protein SMC [Actinomycetes bacterium]|nr:chromosome segregation protein SMC [Actinomycetes bacterium]
MHLKSLTLKGFKSFASATTFHFEPGITCVVGPNGSGKSNVVDALAWVMGEQGAKSLRGGKMEDVIFAGSAGSAGPGGAAGRAPLGRAEVSLTIDNTDGALPIDYAEVTISRIMFRNGGSEYAINGQPCRLLDVQELLSDSGIGREMHVIVGQGQLDAVLSAGPDERRGFIEEAAGVLKHRKRKEKALRKLDAMQANLTRVQDLTVELRRQLKPLGRQAEVARRAAVIQSDVRDARLRLLADDLVQLTATLEAEVADETALRARRAEVEGQLAEAGAREAELETVAAAEAPTLARAQDTWYRLSSLRERFRGTGSLAAERVRHLAGEPDEAPAAGPLTRDPDELERQAEQVRAEEQEIQEAVERDRARLADAVTVRQTAEQALTVEQRRVAAAARAAADRREGLARLAGQVAAARSRVEAGEAELGRLTPAVDEARERAARAQSEFTALETQVAGLDAGEEDLDSAHEEAALRLAAAEDRLAELREEERAAERERAALVARKDALEMGLARKDASGALLAASDRLTGVIGSVSALLTVTPGAETAVAAALGSAADAVAVADLAAAEAAIRLLKDDDAGRALLLVGSGDPAAPATQDLHDPRAAAATGDRPLPAGARRALELVTAPAALRPALTRLLADVVVVDDLAAGRAVVAAAPHLSAVTRDGDLLARHHAAGGSHGTPSRLEVQAAVDEAETRLGEAGHRLDRVRFAIHGLTEEQAGANRDVHGALDRLHESDARMSAVAEQLGQLGAQARAARGEADRLERSIAGAQAAIEADTGSFAELAERLRVAEESPEPDEAEPDTTLRDGLEERARAGRQSEMEVRLAVRTGEERARALAGRADSLVRAAAHERESRARAAARRERRAREAAVAQDVALAAQAALAHLEHSLARAAAAREAAERARAERDAELAALRGRLRELSAEQDRLTDSVHRDEVARAEQRLRIESLQQKALEDHGVEPGTLVEEYGPHQLVPPSPPAPDEVREVEPDPVPYVRAEQEKRLRGAERSLALLGRVNPLALEEFAALEERHQFLAEQLEDLKATRRDLLDIVREVDERVEQVFTAAFQDTAREFEGVFARLFPGGEGRLVLTDPSDMLTTGIEVEARPPGKKVKRLSLLSGGERSLTAVALLVAIFRARPSPFYVMDEVEAALDDVNLGRLIAIMEELREASQLIVITHQKRTMEVADALYGVSMRGDGITTVIGQRMREAQPA